MAAEMMLYTETDHEFYPTPELLVDKMLSGIKWDYIKTILEPSAGKGDILRGIIKRHNGDREWYNGRTFDVDAVEIDPNLRAILKDKYGKGNERTVFEGGLHIVFDDFLRYKPYKTYDLIIMNPPFSNGDVHLLKALDIQKDGGSIVCLLNADTLRNPYTATRRELNRLLEQYEAQIDYIENAFVGAERKTGVAVALIRVSIPHVEMESDFYEKMRMAEEVDETVYESASTELDVTDFIKSAVQHFNVETKAGIALIKQFYAFKPYMKKEIKPTGPYGSDSILRLTDSSDRGYDSVSINSYLKKTRLKYWSALLTNPKFIGKLTGKMQENYQKMVNRLQDYDFNEFNIGVLSAELMANVKTGIEEEILEMFERLSAAHSWHGDDSVNRHYFDGWATNKAWKVNKKVIIPTYGVFDDWSGKPRYYEAYRVLSDIEKIFNYFAGEMMAEVDLQGTLKECFEQGVTKKIRCKHFEATFYKKGTVHLVFNDDRLLERFNIYAAQNRGWLPPSYGKKKYADMDTEEKKVVDAFQGAAKYEEVLREAQYYLVSPVRATQNVALLPGA